MCFLSILNIFKIYIFLGYLLESYKLSIRLCILDQVRFQMCAYCVLPDAHQLGDLI